MEVSSESYNPVKETPSCTYKSACNIALKEKILASRALLQAAGIDDYTDDFSNQPCLSSSAGLTNDDKEDIIDNYQDLWFDYWIKEMIITDDERLILETYLSTQPAPLPLFSNNLINF